MMASTDDGRRGTARRAPTRLRQILRVRQPVDAVEGRRPVALGEGGIVEDVVDEEVHLAPVSEDCLADVDQLGGAVADDVHAEQLQRDAIEDELQQAFQVTDDLPARDLLVEGTADLVRHPFLGQLLLALAYRVDLGGRRIIKKKFRVGIKSNISTNRNNLISGVDRCIHLNAMKKTTITSINRQTIKI